MNVHSDVTPERVIDAVERQQTTLDNPGFCAECGAEADGVEPDARECECEICGEPAVYGAQELMFALNILG